MMLIARAALADLGAGEPCKLLLQRPDRRGDILDRKKQVRVVLVNFIPLPKDELAVRVPIEKRLGSLRDDRLLILPPVRLGIDLVAQVGDDAHGNSPLKIPLPKKYSTAPLMACPSPQ
jgi:hypothetical protein